MLDPVFCHYSSGDNISFSPLALHQYDGRSGVAYCWGLLTAFCFWAQEANCNCDVSRFGDDISSITWENPPISFVDSGEHKLSQSHSGSVPVEYSSLPVMIGIEDCENEVMRLAGLSGD